jgi:purine-binding chemotaxis protein CheW
VSFGIGGSRWCLPVAEVVQIVRHENVHDLPDAQPPVAGVITLHGDVVPVVDLRERLAPAAEEGAGAKKRRILVVRTAGRPYGILVDEVRELVDLEEEADAGTAAALPAYASGRAARGGVALPVLDLARAMDVRPA